MRFLVDANVLSEPTRPAPNQDVVNWFGANESKLVVDPIILGEIQFGILLLPGGAKRRSLEVGSQPAFNDSNVFPGTPPLV